MGAVGTQARTGLDRERFRDLVIDANDGIIAVAGVVEGVLSAGLGSRAAVTAVITAGVAGGIALGGSRYTEVAVERDARQQLLDEERRQLHRSPEQELDELVAFYVEKGLAPDLARTLAVELTRADALAAHAEEEHGIEVDEPPQPPLLAAIASGVAFALGALVVVVTVLLTPSSWRVPTTSSRWRSRWRSPPGSSPGGARCRPAAPWCEPSRSA